MLRGDYEVLDELKGAEMEGWTYRARSMTCPQPTWPVEITELPELPKASSKAQPRPTG
jgi:hypothetical protein